jgi:hypothetical protein
MMGSFMLGHITASTLVIGTFVEASLSPRSIAAMLAPYLISDFAFCP